MIVLLSVLYLSHLFIISNCNYYKYPYVQGRRTGGGGLDGWQLPLNSEFNPSDFERTCCFIAYLGPFSIV